MSVSTVIFSFFYRIHPCCFHLVSDSSMIFSPIHPWHFQVFGDLYSDFFQKWDRDAGGKKSKLKNIVKFNPFFDTIFFGCTNYENAIKKTRRFTILNLQYMCFSCEKSDGIWTCNAAIAPAYRTYIHILSYRTHFLLPICPNIGFMPPVRPIWLQIIILLLLLLLSTYCHSA